MNHLTAGGISSSIKQKRNEAMSHIRGAEGAVLFGNYMHGVGELMRRTQSSMENTPIFVKLQLDGDVFRFIRGGEALGKSELSFRELVELDGEGPNSIIRVLGNTPLAQKVKAVQHLHRIHPEQDIMALKKAVESDPGIVEKNAREQLLSIYESNKAEVSPELERHPDAPVQKLTPGRR